LTGVLCTVGGTLVENKTVIIMRKAVISPFAVLNLSPFRDQKFFFKAFGLSGCFIQIFYKVERTKY
jgi:hypothetical protein